MSEDWLRLLASIKWKSISKDSFFEQQLKSKEIEYKNKLESYQNAYNLKLSKIKSDYDSKISDLNSTVKLLSQKLSFIKLSEKQVK